MTKEYLTDALKSLDLDRHQIYEKIGTGKFGKVYLIEGNRVLKISSILVSKKEQNHQTEYGEKNILPLLINHRCPYVLNINKYHINTNHIFIISNFLDGLEMKQTALYGISLEKKLAICQKLTTGLQFIHSKNIIHLDIKPDNIMISCDYEPLIIDFGLSCTYGTESRNICGTPYYISPEMWLNQKKHFSMDIYSLGVTFYYFISNKKLPFTPYDKYKYGNGNGNKIELYPDSSIPSYSQSKKILRSKVINPLIKPNSLDIDVVNEHSSEFIELIFNMLNKCVTERPSLIAIYDILSEILIKNSSNSNEIIMISEV